MAQSFKYRNPMALWALLVSAAAFLSALSLVGLKLNIGPQTVLYYLVQISGPLLFGSIVFGTGFAVVALTRSASQRDWRIWAAFALQAGAFVASFWFLGAR